MMGIITSYSISRSLRDLESSESQNPAQYNVIDSITNLVPI